MSMKDILDRAIKRMYPLLLFNTASAAQQMREQMAKTSPNLDPKMPKPIPNDRHAERFALAAMTMASDKFPPAPEPDQLNGSCLYCKRDFKPLNYLDKFCCVACRTKYGPISK